MSILLILSDDLGFINCVNEFLILFINDGNSTFSTSADIEFIDCNNNFLFLSLSNT